MVLRRYALSIIALAILESGQWLKRELRFSFFYKAVGVRLEEDMQTALTQWAIYLLVVVI